MLETLLTWCLGSIAAEQSNVENAADVVFRVEDQQEIAPLTWCLMSRQHVATRNQLRC